MTNSQAVLSTRQLAAETARLDAQLKGLRVTVGDLVRTANVGMAQQLHEMAGSKIIYDQYGRALSVAAANTQAIERSTKRVTQAAKEHAKGVEEVARRYAVLGSQWERRASWFLAGTAFFGGLTAMQQAVRTMTEVEAGMTVIARVTEDATFNFEQVRNQLLRLGQEYGMTWQQVSDIMTKWVQAGYHLVLHPTSCCHQGLRAGRHSHMGR